MHRYEAGSSQPTLDVLRALAIALNISADSLLFDEDERGPQSQTLRLKLEAVDQFTPDEQEHLAAFIEGALLRNHARQAFSGQAWHDEPCGVRNRPLRDPHPRAATRMRAAQNLGRFRQRCRMARGHRLGRGLTRTLHR
ncbi:helix-turn-helix transcriptional regulator [Yimella sp. cx-51]|uniref:helix-turn-helix domain-containing protein n=1 Tax=Yimella sp. cx-51 TaxID=2770551 RepID=UPI001FCC20B7